MLCCEVIQLTDEQLRYCVAMQPGVQQVDAHTFRMSCRKPRMLEALMKPTNRSVRYCAGRGHTACQTPANCEHVPFARTPTAMCMRPASP